ncbi:hypothetical protein quinque_008840 [Culex quinquefasciatus]
MTQCRYTNENIPKNNFFECFTEPKKRWYYIPVMEKGAAAIRDENTKLGLAFDEWDINYYTRLFQMEQPPVQAVGFETFKASAEADYPLQELWGIAWECLIFRAIAFLTRQN